MAGSRRRTWLMAGESTIADKGRLIHATVKENVSLTVFDAATKESLAVVPVGEPDVGKPHEIAVTSDGRFALRRQRLRTKYAGQPVGRRQSGDSDFRRTCRSRSLSCSPCHDDRSIWQIWVTVDHSRCVLIVDPVSREIEHTIWLEVPGHFLAAAPDGSKVWFSAKEYPVIVGVNIATRRIGPRIRVFSGAQAIRVSPDNRVLYAGDFNRPLSHLIDLATRKLVKTVGLTGVPGWPFIGRDGRPVIVTTYYESTDLGYVELLKAADMTIAGVVEVPGEPFHALPEPDGRHVLVA